MQSLDGGASDADDGGIRGLDQASYEGDALEELEALGITKLGND